MSLLTQPPPPSFQPPVRNRYFYGKLLDVYHFKLEQDYLNGKRWLLNRLVSGYGVVCGLDVTLCADNKSLAVEPGLAIDKWGREIIVPAASCCLVLPERPKPGGKTPCREEDEWIQVCLCYEECASDPMPTMATECEPQKCAPGSFREHYSLHLKPGKKPPVDLKCSIPDMVPGLRLDYAALARHVSQGCPEPPDDPCIVLANVRLPLPGAQCAEADIDITVRPIVYTNDLLFEIIIGLLRDPQGQHRSGK
jgi:hypothetical protein